MRKRQKEGEGKDEEGVLTRQRMCKGFVCREVFKQVRNSLSMTEGILRSTALIKQRILGIMINYECYLLTFKN